MPYTVRMPVSKYQSMFIKWFKKSIIPMFKCEHWTSGKHNIALHIIDKEIQSRKNNFSLKLWKKETLSLKSRKLICLQRLHLRSLKLKAEQTCMQQSEDAG